MGGSPCNYSCKYRESSEQDLGTNMGGGGACNYYKELLLYTQGEYCLEPKVRYGGVYLTVTKTVCTVTTLYVQRCV
jgi:hypothetical protein